MTAAIMVLPEAEIPLPQPIALLLAIQSAQPDAEDLSGFVFVVPH